MEGTQDYHDRDQRQLDHEQSADERIPLNLKVEEVKETGEQQYHDGDPAHRPGRGSNRPEQFPTRVLGELSERGSQDQADKNHSADPGDRRENVKPDHDAPGQKFSDGLSSDAGHRDLINRLGIFRKMIPGRFPVGRFENETGKLGVATAKPHRALQIHPVLISQAKLKPAAGRQSQAVARGTKPLAHRTDDPDPGRRAGDLEIPGRGAVLKRQGDQRIASLDDPANFRGRNEPIPVFDPDRPQRHHLQEAGRRPPGDREFDQIGKLVVVDPAKNHGVESHRRQPGLKGPVDPGQDLR